MKFTDNDLSVFDRNVLKLPKDSRDGYMRQIDYLIGAARDLEPSSSLANQEGA